MDAFIQIMLQYGLLAIAIAIILEYACFPVPSEVVLPLAGMVTVANGYNLYFVIALSVLCGIIGSSICYIIGYSGGSRLIKKIKERYPKMEKGITLSEIKFQKYATFAVSFGRIIPLCRTYISFIAGANKQKFFVFILFTSLGVIVWNGCLVSLGYLFCDNLDYISLIYEKYKVIIFCMFFVFLIIFIFWKLKKKKS